MKQRAGVPWKLRHTTALAALVACAVYVLRHPFLDIIALGRRDEEQSHIFLAPVVALWLFWLRRSRLRYVNYKPSFIGLGTIAFGWVLCWWGFDSGIQVAWHGGAVIVVLGILLSMTGAAPLKLFAPVFIVLVFILPVPGVIRHQVAMPLQQLATSVTYAMLELIGVSAVKSGNVLWINGAQVAVGEACNGMRMVFALTLVVYAFAFGTPLRPTTRIVLLLLSPIVAIVCNVLRLVPTSLIYGSGSYVTAERFHDLAGWIMLPLALFVLAMVLRTIRWLEFPVSSFRLASQ